MTDKIANKDSELNFTPPQDDIRLEPPNAPRRVPILKCKTLSVTDVDKLNLKKMKPKPTEQDKPSPQNDSESEVVSHVTVAKGVRLTRHVHQDATLPYSKKMPTDSNPSRFICRPYLKKLTSRPSNSAEDSHSQRKSKSKEQLIYHRETLLSKKAREEKNRSQKLSDKGIAYSETLPFVQRKSQRKHCSSADWSTSKRENSPAFDLTKAKAKGSSRSEMNVKSGSSFKQGLGKSDFNNVEKERSLKDHKEIKQFILKKKEQRKQKLIEAKNEERRKTERRSICLKKLDEKRKYVIKRTSNIPVMRAMGPTRVISAPSFASSSSSNLKSPKPALNYVTLRSGKNGSSDELRQFAELVKEECLDVLNANKSKDVKSSSPLLKVDRSTETTVIQKRAVHSQSTNFSISNFSEYIEKEQSKHQKKLEMNARQEAACKIQAMYKGYKFRKDLEESRKKNTNILPALTRGLDQEKRRLARRSSSAVYSPSPYTQDLLEIASYTSKGGICKVPIKKIPDFCAQLPSGLLFSPNELKIGPGSSHFVKDKADMPRRHSLSYDEPYPAAAIKKLQDISIHDVGNRTPRRVSSPVDIQAILKRRFSGDFFTPSKFLKTKPSTPSKPSEPRIKNAVLQKMSMASGSCKTPDSTIDPTNVTDLKGQVLSSGSCSSLETSQHSTSQSNSQSPKSTRLDKLDPTEGNDGQVELTVHNNISSCDSSTTVETDQELIDDSSSTTKFNSQMSDSTNVETESLVFPALKLRFQAELEKQRMTKNFMQFTSAYEQRKKSTTFSNNLLQQDFLRKDKEQKHCIENLRLMLMQSQANANDTSKRFEKIIDQLQYGCEPQGVKYETKIIEKVYCKDEAIQFPSVKSLQNENDIEKPELPLKATLSSQSSLSPNDFMTLEQKPFKVEENNDLDEPIILHDDVDQKEESKFSENQDSSVIYQNSFEEDYQDLSNFRVKEQADENELESNSNDSCAASTLFNLVEFEKVPAVSDDEESSIDDNTFTEIVSCGKDEMQETLFLPCKTEKVVDEDSSDSDIKQSSSKSKESKEESPVPVPEVCDVLSEVSEALTELESGPCVVDGVEVVDQEAGIELSIPEEDLQELTPLEKSLTVECVNVPEEEKTIEDVKSNSPELLDDSPPNYVDVLQVSESLNDKEHTNDVNVTDLDSVSSDEVIQSNLLATAPATADDIACPSNKSSLEDSPNSLDTESISLLELAMGMTPQEEEVEEPVAVEETLDPCEECSQKPPIDSQNSPELEDRSLTVGQFLEPWIMQLNPHISVEEINTLISEKVNAVWDVYSDWNKLAWFQKISDLECKHARSEIMPSFAGGDKELRSLKLMVNDLIDDSLRNCISLCRTKGDYMDVMDDIRGGAYSLIVKESKAPKSKEDLSAFVTSEAQKYIPSSLVQGSFSNVPDNEERIQKRCARPKDLVDEVLVEELIDEDPQWVDIWPEQIVIEDRLMEKVILRAIKDVVRNYEIAK